jgi:hypothetical protein
MFVIVFRGTQPTSIPDLKADLDTFLIAAEGGGKVHRGFFNAFNKVRDQLEKDMEHSENLPVYITGHSLGGALAMLATRYLARDSVGATYTFGCPRAADDEFYRQIKTPVYRIVNSADGVSRIPFGNGLNFFLSGLRLIPISRTKAIAEWIRRKFVGFTHHGNVTMLGSLPEVKEGKDPYDFFKVHKSPDIFTIAYTVFPRLLATFGKAALTDHSMEGYSEKLRHYALRRKHVGRKPQTVPPADQGVGNES